MFGDALCSELMISTQESGEKKPQEQYLVGKGCEVISKRLGVPITTAAHILRFKVHRTEDTLTRSVCKT